MRRTIGAFLMMAAGAAGAWLLAAPAAPAQQPKQAAAKKGEEKREENREVPVEAIDPRGEGKPAKMRAIEAPNVGLAYEKDGWQVQCRPGAADWTRIDGTIEVVGGSIDRVGGFADLESSRNGGKNEHIDQASYNKRRIEFKIWVKKGGTDTFRFYVTDDAQTIRFRFRISNKPVAEDVYIGVKGRHPSQPEFALDAHPERRPGG